MPIPDLYKNLIATISNQTKDNQLQWTRDGFFGFSAQIGDKNSIKIWEGIDENSDKNFVSFALIDSDPFIDLNSSERIQDSWFVEEGEREYQEIKDLHDEARRSSNNIRETIKHLEHILTTPNKKKSF